MRKASDIKGSQLGSDLSSFLQSKHCSPVRCLRRAQPALPGADPVVGLSNEGHNDTLEQATLKVALVGCPGDPLIGSALSHRGATPLLYGSRRHSICPIQARGEYQEGGKLRSSQVPENLLTGQQTNLTSHLLMQLQQGYMKTERLSAKMQQTNKCNT